MIELLYFLIFLAVVFSIGRKVISFFRLKLTKIEEFLVSIAIGSGVLMYAIFFLGVFQLLYAWVYLVMIFLVFLFSIKEVVYLGYLIKTAFKYVAGRIRFNLSGILWFFFIFFIIINLVVVFVPVSEWDPAAYHLAFANNYQRHNGLIDQPTQRYGYMPHGMTMLFTASESFYPGTLSVLIVYLFNISVGMGIYSIVRKKYSETSALISALVFLTLPVVIERLSQPMIDLSVTFFFICAIVVFLKYIEEKDCRTKFRQLLVMSFLMGVCLFIKFTAIFLLAALIIGIMFDKMVYKRKHPLKHIMVLLVISLILISPWLVRAYVHTGNPVYPFGYGIFGGKYLGGQQTQVYETYRVSPLVERNLLNNTLLVLWNMTFRSSDFQTPIGLSPFYMIIIPLILFFYKGIKDLRQWILLFVISVSIMVFITWFVTPVMRFLLSAIVLLSILTGIIVNVMIKQRILKLVIIIFLIVSLTFNLAIWWGINSKNVYFLASSQTKEEYYSKLKSRDPYIAMQWINENTPDDSKILLVKELRGYYLNRDYIVNDPLIFYIDYYSMSSSNELIKRLEELGVSYILINEGPLYEPKLGQFYNISLSLIQDASRNMTLVYNESQITVYMI